MTWDVFISYASEDRPFAQRLAKSLQETGLTIWFDQFSLEAGDSLRRSIDQGLRESSYGVVVLSSHFFKKEWTQKELDSLVAREDGKSKVIIPVWYKVTADEVKQFSLILADKLAISTDGSIKTVTDAVLRAISRAKVGQQGWAPSSLLTTSGIEAIVLPVRPLNNRALCIGRFPVTNQEYETFVKDSGHRVPSGENFNGREWLGPFTPWADTEFSGPDQPVVCVDFLDALAYCKWLTKRGEEKIFLPSAALWDFSVTGIFGASVKTGAPLQAYREMSSPMPLARSGERDNVIGVSDMIGNVWEWCVGEFPTSRLIARVGAGRNGTVMTGAATIGAVFGGQLVAHTEVRGGSFLDDLSKGLFSISSLRLRDGTQTRHSDLGFRVATLLPLDRLSHETQALLKIQPYVPEDLWTIL